MTDLLRDVRVVELSDGCSAAFCGRLFARMGADVVLIERPRTGSAVRWLPPFLDDRVGLERGGLFMFTASGKRSLTLDPEHPDGRAILERLLERADVLIDDRGLSAAPDEDFAGRTNPRLVRLALRRFAAGGPYEKWLATELQLAALGGWMAQLGEPRRTPLISNSRTMTAFVPGVVGAIAALAAVRAARASGHGWRIDVAAQEALLFTTRFNETFLSYTGTEIKRAGDRYPAWAAYRTFKAADGDVTAAAATDAQIEALMKVAGVDDPRFKTRPDREARVDEFGAEISRWAAAHTREEIFRQCQENRVPMGKVNRIEEVAAMEQVKARGFFEEIEHPVAGRRRFPGGPARFGGEWPAPRRAPLLGEHTKQILTGEFQYAGAELRRARRDGCYMSADRLLLDGVRVVDFTAYWAGPLPTAIMADLGAEVIKVESIQRPDQFRIVAIPGDPAEVYELSPPFNATNRNKLSLTLDLARPAGVRLFKELVKRADAVVQNYSPRVMPQLGLSYETLREVKPAIVMTSVSGFGQEGPWRDYVSFAAIGEALSGISGLSGYTGEGALIHGVGVSDPFASYLAAFCTLAAVHHARATGEGRHVDVSQLEASMQYIADALVEFEFTGRPRARATSDDSAASPHGAFPARGDDAWIAISVTTEQEWCALLAAMVAPEWAAEARFATPMLRRHNREALNRLLAEWTVRFDRHELARDLQARGVPAAPVLAPSDLLEDPGLVAAGFFQFVDHPAAGRHPYPSFPALIDGEHPPIKRVGPILGADNHYVLSKILGLGDAEIAGLEADRIIGNRPLY